MIQEPELEEGETCYYKDDASIDPDIALSYIVWVSFLPVGNYCCQYQKNVNSMFFLK